ncbi:MAG: PD-(D/E)XK nuclease family transposase [Prevotellaceae bacterium]|jgi:predicted transposase/invertase (TIGR01784 family)|nr:PD-(D/E)XK nuclease family transposase [Prevotellaceae bacterium]
MAHYLDPKNDLTFYRIFKGHKNLCISLLNSMLPLSKEQKIVSVEFQANELLPAIPLLQDSVVSFCCTDNFGHQFVVGMQIIWVPVFRHRVLLNGSKAYVRLNTEIDCRLAQPIYSLNFVYDAFDRDPSVYYHNYKTVNVENSEKQIEGLELIFIELSKFSPSNCTEKKLYDLWLTFLTKIRKGDETVPQELLDEDVTKEAVKYLERDFYSKAELNAYDKYLDVILTARTYYADAYAEGYAKGYAEGYAKGYAKGKEEGIAIGEEKNFIKTVINGARAGFSLEQIQLITGASKERIEKILNSNT